MAPNLKKKWDHGCWLLVTTILFWGVPNDLTHAALVMAWLGSSLAEPCKRQTGGTRRTCLSKDIAPHFQEFVFPWCCPCGKIKLVWLKFKQHHQLVPWSGPGQIPRRPPTFATICWEETTSSSWHQSCWSHMGLPENRHIMEYPQFWHIIWLSNREKLWLYIQLS